MKRSDICKTGSKKGMHRTVPADDQMAHLKTRQRRYFDGLLALLGAVDFDVANFGGKLVKHAVDILVSVNAAE